MDCREGGILVNVGGGFTENHRRYSMVIDGKAVEDFAGNSMDGLFIYNNLVQMRDDAPYGAVQAQAEGLRNVIIRNNTLRTTSGQGHARAIGILRATNVVVHDNICESNMYAEIIPPAVAWYNNLDLLGQAMKNVRGQPIIVHMPENPAPPQTPKREKLHMIAIKILTMSGALG